MNDNLKKFMDSNELAAKAVYEKYAKLRLQKIKNRPKQTNYHN